MEFNIAVLSGDGIGPEVTAEGVKALEAVGRAFGHTFNLEYGDVGGISIDRHGTPLTQEVQDLAGSADAVLFGAVGGPKWDDPSAPVRPEDGLLRLRAHLGVFANIRPVKVYPNLVESSVLKPEVLEGVDMVVVRELTGGLYYAEPKGRHETPQGWTGVDTMRYSEAEIERVLRVGFELARGPPRQAGLHRQGQRPGVLPFVAPDSHPPGRGVSRTWNWSTCWWTPAPCNWCSAPPDSTS